MAGRSSDAVAAKNVAKVLHKDWLDPKKNSAAQLLAHLRALDDFLVKASPDEGLDLSGAAGGLSNEAIVESADGSVRLTAALCSAELIRLSAPETPFAASQIESIFTLLVDSLAALGDLSSPDTKSAARLLERLAQANAFSMIADEPQLRLELFKTLFSAISEKHSKMVVVHVSSILTNVILEAERVGTDILKVMCAPFLEANPDQGAHVLAHQIFASAAANKLAPAVEEFVGKVMAKLESGDADLRDQLHQLVHEIFHANPALLDSILPRFEEYMKSTVPEVRRDVTQLFAVLFSLKISPPLSKYTTLVAPFLQRFKDSEVFIREIMCREFAPRFIANHPSDPAVHSTLESLKESILSVDEKVRAAAFQGLATIATTADMQLLTPALLELAIRLLRDKKEDVRNEAARTVALIYARFTSLHGAHAEWPNTPIAKLIIAIPRELLQLAANTELIPLVESVFQDIILPKRTDEPSKDEFQSWVDLITALTDPSSLVFVLRHKAKFMDAFKLFVEQRAGSGDKPDAVTQHRIAFLSRQLPHGNTTDTFNKFNRITDKRLFQHLQTLMDHDSSLARLTTARESIEKMFISTEDKASKLRHLLVALVHRLNPLNLSSSLLSLLLEQAIIAPLPNDNLRRVLISLVQDFTPLFNESLQVTVDGMKDEDASTQSFALHVLSRIGKLFRDDIDLTNPLRDPLLKILGSGRAPHAKFAVRALAAAFEPDRISASITKSAKALLSSVTKGQTLEGDLLALMQLARSFPASFNAVSNSLADYILDTLLWEQEDMEHDGLTPLALGKVAAMKVLREFVRSKKADPDATEHAERVYEALFSIVAASGSTNRNEDGVVEPLLADLVHKYVPAHILSAAARTVVQLSVDRSFDLLVTPARFIQLADVAVHMILEVRRSLLKALRKGLVAFNLLSPRYLAILSLYGAELESDVFKDAKSILNATVTARRDFLKSSPSTNPQDDARRNAIMPENAFSYLIHVLAHINTYTSDRAAGFEETLKCLSFYFDAVLRSDNVIYFLDHLQIMLTLQDSLDPDSTHLHEVCEIAQRFIKKQAEKKTLPAQNKTSKVSLPPSIYVRPAAPFPKAKSYLPENFSPVIKKHRPQKGASKASAIPSSEPDDAMDLEGDSMPPPPSRKTPSPGNKRKRTPKKAASSSSGRSDEPDSEEDSGEDYRAKKQPRGEGDASVSSRQPSARRRLIDKLYEGELEKKSDNAEEDAMDLEAPGETLGDILDSIAGKEKKSKQAPVVEEKKGKTKGRPAAQKKAEVEEEEEEEEEKEEKPAPRLDRKGRGKAKAEVEEKEVEQDEEEEKEEEEVAKPHPAKRGRGKKAAK